MIDHRVSVTWLFPKKTKARHPLAADAIDGYGRLGEIGQPSLRRRANDTIIVSFQRRPLEPTAIVMLQKIVTLCQMMATTGKDLLPIVLVVAFFQIVVLQKPFPNLGEVIGGVLLVTLGLTLFIRGLEMGLFPLGESMAEDFAKKGVLTWLLIFGFALGFGTTVAEPALIAVAGEAAAAAAEAGVVDKDAAAMGRYATGLRYTVAISVGAALVIGVIRILKGWPIQYFIIGGYILVMILTPLAPDDIVGIAYDSGGVTTSTVTVPLVTALGVGLATVIRGRSPLIDGFGLIAFASLTPIIFVLIYGMLV